MEENNHMIIIIDTEKEFDKIQHAFEIKILNKLSTEGTYLNTIKAIYEQPSVLKIRNKTRVLTITTSIQHSTGNPSSKNNRGRKRKLTELE